MEERIFPFVFNACHGVDNKQTYPLDMFVMKVFILKIFDSLIILGELYDKGHLSYNVDKKLKTTLKARR